METYQDCRKIDNDQLSDFSLTISAKDFFFILLSSHEMKSKYSKAVRSNGSLVRIIISFLNVSNEVNNSFLEFVFGNFFLIKVNTIVSNLYRCFLL